MDEPVLPVCRHAAAQESCVALRRGSYGGRWHQQVGRQLLSGLGPHDLLAQMLGTLVTLLTNFLMSKRWMF